MTEPKLTESKLREIEQRVNTATPGAWHWFVDILWNDSGDRIITPWHTSDEVGCHISIEDAEFIAHAREDIDTLTAAVRERDTRIQALEQVVNAFRRWGECLNEFDDVSCCQEWLQAAWTALDAYDHRDGDHA